MSTALNAEYFISLVNLIRSANQRDYKKSDMITVAILINGQPIVAKNAVNTGKLTKKGHKYVADGGDIIYHNRDDGAVAIAKKLLDTIRNDDIHR